MSGYNEILRLALSSIWRNKTRSVLTMLGVVIGVASVILLVSLGQGLQKFITDSFEDLGTNVVVILPGQVDLEQGIQGPPNFAGSKFTLRHVTEINNLGGPIDSAAASIELPAAVSYKGESKYTTIAGISSEYGSIRNLAVSKGRNITRSDVDLERKVVILGEGMVRDRFGATNPLGKEITRGEEKLTVVGVLEEIGGGNFRFDINNFVAIPITTSQRIFGDDSIQLITAKASSKEDIPHAITVLKNYMSTQLEEEEYSVVDQGSLVSTINNILGVITTALGGIAAISLVVGGVGIMNIMLVSVTERTREIGLRKAVGAKPQNILVQFLIEATVLSGVGGLIGILIGAGGALILGKFLVETSVSFWSVALAFGVSAAVGIIFGVAPALRASKLDPIDALRYE